MTNSLGTGCDSSPEDLIQSFDAAQWLQRLVFGMAGLTLFLMALGSATRVMNAGLSCPDWPLCYGVLVPRQQMNFQVFLEWFHRLVASSLGILAIALTGLAWRWRKLLPTWMPATASFSLGLVILQGLLGGLTVTQLLRFDIVTAHLGTGLLFFVTLLGMGLLLLPYSAAGGVGRLPWLSAIAAVLVYGQSLLGGLVSSQWALHQCLTGSHLCAVMNSHLMGVVPATLSIVLLGIGAGRQPLLHPLLRWLSKTILLLLGLQLGLGFTTFKLHLQVAWVTVGHQAVGALLLGTLVGFMVISLRDRHQTQQRAQASLPSLSANV
jgi:heme a synthase